MLKKLSENLKKENGVERTLQYVSETYKNSVFVVSPPIHPPLPPKKSILRHRFFLPAISTLFVFCLYVFFRFINK